MNTIKCKIWYPVLTKIEDEIDVDIPDDVKPDEYEEYLIENAQDIIENESLETLELSAVEYGYAGIKLIK